MRRDEILSTHLDVYYSTRPTHSPPHHPTAQPQAFAIAASIALSPVLGKENADENYATCVGYLDELKSALVDGSMADVKRVAYTQYTAQPAGPYTFCFTEVHLAKDDVNKITLAVHPYLEEGLTLADLMDGKDQEYVKDKKEMYSRAFQEERLSFYNYTERFAQEETELADAEGDDVLVTSSTEQDLVGFLANDPELGSDGVVECACRYTGVPPRLRLADNTIGFLASSAGHLLGATAAGVACLSLVLLG